MLKKLCIIVAVTILSFSAQSGRFNAGEDYQVLDLPKTHSPTITHFFSFFCLHCYKSEDLMKELKKQIPENTQFQKNHVSFMGGNMGKELNKAYATAVILNVEDTMIPVIFHRIHLLQKPPMNLEELRKMYIDKGIQAEKFDATYNSFIVNSMANRFDKEFQDSGLQSVPAVIVNGRYHLTPKTITTPADYVSLVQFLLIQ
ncbi:Periplasmic thiol:disulfide interchange protein DsbA [Candidatus Enterovibrio escicola]|uniref:Thiol:disulfide interchange protein n=1 Tax=Candidatus Enterovibrio escicola TaxID=1927127 RepID=A0A2A5T568_9GAMM|nr:Periplasmic thiol:disulfide interchange protein DsbA [Candidatus Enterovibrio escacola]